MAKVITINYRGVDYTLEFTRRTCAELQNSGFDPEQIDTKPLVMIPMLIRGAFLAHHRLVQQTLADEIFANIPNKPQFIEKLAEMYAAPINTLMEEPEKGNEGNASWGASW